MPRTMKSILRAQGRLRKLSPIAIIDIGSNSVRLVVYEGLSRSPTPLFNEKILCGLGSAMASTGRLDDDAVERALKALRRFKMLATQAGADGIYPLATEAARVAENGASFIQQAEQILGTEIHVLTGTQEAEYAALGIACGFIDPQGVVGDMGGGSVELTTIGNGNSVDSVSLAVGGLRLQDEFSSDIVAVRKHVHAMLKGNPVLKQAKGKTFYAVGGTWRAIGRLHMARAKYPLNVMHNYEISAKEARRLCSRLTGKNGAAIRGIEAVSSNRRHLLPYGAALLSEIMAIMKPDKIVFSALGVREGYLYSLLPDKRKKADPLVSAAEEFAVLRARSPAHARELVQWTKAAFKLFGIKEYTNEKRYRKAACMLADITWRSHPDYRGGQALNLISNADFVGVEHEGRAYLALASYYRHQGLMSDDVSPEIIGLAGDRVRYRAKLLGALFRVAFQLSTAMPGVLLKTHFEKTDSGYALIVPKELGDFHGERLERRFRDLANMLRQTIEWQVK